MINKETTNTFKDGLVMDLNPITTPNTVLTNCLNGTILTFNGNEHVLQNDMGNGRVETAYLPEGYVPIGTCSYGGIVYIVSYNPLINRSQIGSFPSPERNIESTELSDIKVTLSPNELVDNGEVVSFSVKKELIDEINPGDKFIVFSDNINGEYLSDFGNTDHIDGAFPKLWKLQIALLEDSGKVNILDNVKWYDNDYHILQNKDSFDETTSIKDVDEYRSVVSSAYSVVNSKKSGKLILLASPETIDDFNCTWTVLDSKSTSTDKDGNPINISANTYSIGLDFNWQTSNNDINISSVSLEIDNTSYIDKGSIKESIKELPISRFYTPEEPVTYEDFKNKYSYNSIIVKEYINDLLSDVKIQPKFYINEKELTLIRIIDNNSISIDRIDDKYLINCTHIYKDDKGTTHYYTKIDDKIIEIFPKKINDDILNNHFKKSIVHKIFNITVPEDATDIINLKVTPCMPYGKLDHLAQDLTIDLSKLGKKIINLNRWRYYTYSDTLMLNWGLDAYAEPNKTITGVDMEFYDNSGRAAVYHVKNKESYNGQFINYINLNGNSNYYNIDDLDHNGQIFFHPKSDLLIDHNQANLETGTYFYYKGTYKEDSKKDSITSWFDENDKLDLANIELVTEDKIKKWNDSNEVHKVCESDAGIIYNSAVYLVKINVYYGSIDSFGRTNEDLDSTTFYRWLWTNEIFNDKYDEHIDFKDLNPELYLDIDIRIKTNSNFNLKKIDYSNRTSISDDPVDTLDNLSSTVQTVGFEENNDPNVEAEIGILFQDNFKTFQLNGDIDENTDISPLSNIIIKSYLNNLSSKNNPEQPEVINSDENSHLILPKVDDEFKLPKGVKEQLGLNTDENDKDIWEKDTDYNNYAELNLVEKSDTDSNILEFINSDGKLVSKTGLDYNETNYHEIFNNHKQLELRFKGIHHSKYYTTSEGQQDITGRELRPFILNISDLSKYNLDLVEEDLTDKFQLNPASNIPYSYRGKPYCTHALAIGRSYSGNGPKVEINVAFLKYDNTLSISEFSNTYKHGKIKNRKLYRTINTIAKDADAINIIKNEIDFPLIPILPGPIALDGDGKWDGGKTNIIKDKKSIALSSTRRTDNIADISSLGNSRQHGGLFGVISNSNVITDLNHPVTANVITKIEENQVVIDNDDKNKKGPWHYTHLTTNDLNTKVNIPTNVIIHYASYIFSLLIQTYYLSRNVTTTKKYIYDKYTYLANNQFQYTKDLIINASVSNDDNLLLMRGVNYNQYIEQILKHSEGNHNKDPNINIKIRSCTKTFPVQFKFEYITPELKQYDSSNLVYVNQSNLDNVNDASIEWLWDDAQIVYYDKNSKSFKELSSSYDFNLYDSVLYDEITNFFEKKIKNLTPASWSKTFKLSSDLANSLYNEEGILKVRDFIDGRRSNTKDKIHTGSNSDLDGNDHVSIFIDSLTESYEKN